MKSLFKHIIVLIISALATSSCTPRASKKGVEINGVTWAVSNIAEPGKFTAAPHKPGPHHDFKTCFAAENPCPRGWKIPGYSDFAKLTDSQSVSCEWASMSDAKNSGAKGSEQKYGLKFTDLATGQSLFLPAAGMTNDSGEHCDDDSCCFYWSLAPHKGELPANVSVATGGGYFLHFDWNKAAKKGAVAGVDKNLRVQYRFNSNAPRHRFSVRCVKASETI